MKKSNDYKSGYIDGFKFCQKIIKQHIIKSIMDTDVLVKDLKYKEQGDDNKTTD